MFQSTKLQHEQALDFVRSLKKDLAKLTQNLEKKYDQYLGGRGEENETENKNFRFIASTLVEGVKRVIESIQKRIDSFVFYSSGQSQHQSQTSANVQIVDTLDARILNS